MYKIKNSYSLKEAIVYRILGFCQENNISINELALRSGITQSTLQNIVSYKTKDIYTTTLYKICYGMNMKLYEFYQDKVFENIHEIW